MSTSKEKAESLPADQVFCTDEEGPEIAVATMEDINFSDVGQAASTVCIRGDKAKESVPAVDGHGTTAIDLTMEDIDVMVSCSQELLEENAMIEKT